MDISNLVDYGPVVGAYQAIVQQDSTWFLLTYTENNDRLLLHAHGTQYSDLGEFKSHLDDLAQVYIGFYHEASKSANGFVLINYIPTTVSGVRRARALVHSRRIGSALIKTEHAILTVDHISNITPAAIRDAILNPDSVHTIQINRSFSSITPVTPISPTSNQNPDSPNHNQQFQTSAMNQVRRSFTEIYAPSYSTAPPPPPVSKAHSGSMFTSILRRKHHQKDGTKTLPSRMLNPEADLDDFGLPPPPPPKDKDTDFGGYHSRTHASTYTPFTRQQHYVPSLPRQTSMSDLVSEFAVISHEEAEPQPRQDHASHFIVPLEKKWIPESTFIPDPHERARRRRLAQEQREREEEEAIRAEEERQARIKRERDELLFQEQQEEERRRASLDEELRRARAERRLREEREKEEDRRKKEEIASRKRADRERRLEEHRKQEKWRQEQAKLTSEAEAREAEARKREEVERKRTVQHMVAQVKDEVHKGFLLDGWVTIQISESVVWRRRYFKVIGSTIFFYRNNQELNLVSDELELQGKLSGVREWSEGFEELKAIPYSFAIEFKDGREPWGLFSDSAEEKDKLLGILHYAAGLKV
ncbi:hypothetical protein AAF712_005708 [Marasmius tenuissimus]|uniref:ADF-H domain-containing protein n=1 Tax=Marasmius tenuissimus TaxID=585030 RepID=A0ABR3A0H7_9AGAR